MCGLVGMAGDLIWKHRHVMKTLLFFNTLRGKDSTGVAAWNIPKNEIETRKMTCPGFEFIQYPFIDNFLGLYRGVWLGHGRASTVGSVTKLNAHPFNVEDEDGCIGLFGAHNGTLKNKWDIEKLLDGERFGTDSEALLNLIYKMGAKEALAETEGAYALTWVDTVTKEVNLVRNKERPLCYAFTDDMRCLIWASEPWMIRIACMREGVELAKNNDKETIWSLPEDTLFKFKVPQFIKKEDGFDVPEREGGLLGKPEKKNFLPSYGGVGYDPDINEPWWKTQQKAEEKARQEGAPSKDKGESKDLLTGFEGKPVERSFVEELKKHGCDWCDGPITDSSFGWMDEMNIVCGHCIRGSHFMIKPDEGKIIQRVLSLVGVKGK